MQLKEKKIKINLTRNNKVNKQEKPKVDIIKLRFATGIVGIAEVTAILFFAFFTMPYASSGLNEVGVAIAFIILLFAAVAVHTLLISGFCVIAVLQLITSLLCIFKKSVTLSFNVLIYISAFFDAVCCIVIIYLAVAITGVIGGYILPLSSALCALPIITALVLKILCAVTFRIQMKNFI